MSTKLYDKNGQIVYDVAATGAQNGQMNQAVASGEYKTVRNTTQNTGDVPQVNTGNQQTQNASQNTGYAAPQNNIINMPGVSSDQKAAIGQLTATNYAPSQNVISALSGLDAVIAQQPAEFRSGYTAQLNNIYNQILGRPAFSYDLASDPMWQNYRQQYMMAGRNAMEDTMGQAATLTGGYGNSYATTAGQQQYNAYLQQLNDRVPELYGLARDAYTAEGDALAQQYAMASDAYNREYGEWLDGYNRWYDMLNFEQGRFEADRNYDLQQQAMELDRQQLAYQQSSADRAYYYDLAMSMIEMGKTPPDSILLQAGMTQDEIEAIRAQVGKSSGSSSGSNKTGTSGSGSTSKDYNTSLKFMGLNNKINDNSGSSSTSVNWLGNVSNTLSNTSGSASTSGNWLSNAANKAASALSSKSKNTLNAVFNKLSK